MEAKGGALIGCHASSRKPPGSPCSCHSYENGSGGTRDFAALMLPSVFVRIRKDRSTVRNWGHGRTFKSHLFTLRRACFKPAGVLGSPGRP
jgi:hypothetical protein